MSFFSEITPQQRLDKAVIGIWENPKYTSIAGTMMVGERSVSNTIPTACTNGRDELYGEQLIEALTDPELRFVILHENRHKIYRHMKVYEELWKANPNMANKAMDYVINLEILSENTDGFAKMPTGDYAGLLDERFRGKTVQEVFDTLEKESDDPDNNSGTNGQPTDSSVSGTTGDQNTAVGFDEHDFEGAGELTEAEEKEIELEIDQALRQGQIAAGKLGASGGLDLDKLLEPKIDWRDILREFVQSTCAGKDFSTWSKPNRRYIGSNIYMPSTLSEQVRELVLAVDTSGSVVHCIKYFLSEIVGICKAVRPERIRLIYWDHMVQKEEVYSTLDLEELPKSTSPKGGGGTQIEPVCGYLKNNHIEPQAVIVFTDGYLAGSWGKWNHPVLWCVLDNKDAKPDNGRVLHINSTDVY
jgi:predicted metal-dependent peptidase